MSLRAFYLDESPTHPGYYSIRTDINKIPFTCLKGSLNVLPARLMNLTYANYLRFCRDILHAEVYGKGSMYPVAYFKRNEISEQFINLLNKRAEFCIFEKEHPEILEIEENKKKKNT